MRGLIRDKLQELAGTIALRNEQGFEAAKTGVRLGIGLTLVKRLVELHDGTVEARSDGPGLGTEFIVRLPIYGG